MSDPVHPDRATPPSGSEAPGSESLAPEASASEDSLGLRFFSDPAELGPVRKAVEHYCAEAGLTRVACDDMGLCTNEALANVMRHAYAGATDRPIELSARRFSEGARQGVVVSIRDWGDGVNPETLPPREPDPLTPGGLGLICMRRMMTRVVFSPQPDGMLLQLLKFDDPAP